MARSPPHATESRARSGSLPDGRERRYGLSGSGDARWRRSTPRPRGGQKPAKERAELVAAQAVHRERVLAAHVDLSVGDGRDCKLDGWSGAVAGGDRAVVKLGRQVGG